MALTRRELHENWTGKYSSWQVENYTYNTLNHWACSILGVLETTGVSECS